MALTLLIGLTMWLSNGASETDTEGAIHAPFIVLYYTHLVKTLYPPGKAPRGRPMGEKPVKQAIKSSIRGSK
jgi:hypothetical protein